jgi:hypothetical protein
VLRLQFYSFLSWAFLPVLGNDLHTLSDQRLQDDSSRLGPTRNAPRVISRLVKPAIPSPRADLPTYLPTYLSTWLGK